MLKTSKRSCLDSAPLISLQDHVSNCLLALPVWMAARQLQVYQMFNPELQRIHPEAHPFPTPFQGVLLLS